MANRAALILAGGSAKRFQTQNQPWQDKALAEFEGKPLLVHVIKNLQNVADEVAVCVNNQERKAQYSQVLQTYALKNVKIVVDKKDSAISGPVLAIMSGLHAVSATYCLTVPTDMPFLKPEVADYLFNAAEGFDVATPMWPDGTLETLVMALTRRSGVEITDALATLNKPRANCIPRGASNLLLISPMQRIKTLDPELRSFININCREDLTKLETRNTQGTATENRCFNRGKLPILLLRRLQEGQKLLGEKKHLEAQSVFTECMNKFEALHTHFWTGVSAEKLGETYLKGNNQYTKEVKEAYLRAVCSYQAEAEMYGAKGCRLLAERATTDAAWCQSQVKGV